MKRIVVLLACFLITGMAFADKVGMADALKKAQAFMPGLDFETKAYSPSSGGIPGQNPFYLFNVKDGGGYVLVSADDRTTAILGYSTKGNIDMDHIPDNLRYWLDSYAAQLKAIDDGTLVAVTRAGTRGNRSNIAPLLTCQWNQGGPYNLMCPDGSGIDYNQTGYNQNNRCITGCVATATAQVMYYHKWPKVTTAIPSYQLNIEGNDVTLNALPSATFEWDKMKDTYTYGESGESGKAVAKLMRYVGQAFEIGYGVRSTGGNIYNDAMINYFGYSKHIHTVYRDHYTVTQWEDMIYEELANKRPVPYSGFSDNGGGHQFVCDGYEDGYFHLNWGWGGYLDGNFILSIADPYGQQETGGSSGAYKYGQDAVLNFVPAEPNEEEIPVLQTVETEILATNYTRKSASADFTGVTIPGRFYYYYNYTPSTAYNAEIGWGLYEGEKLKQCIGTSTQELNSSRQRWYTDNKLGNASFGAKLANGKYQLRQIFRKAGSSDAWKLMDGYGVNFLVAEINGTRLTIRVADNSSDIFTVNSLSISDEPSVGANVTVTMNITNTGDTNKETVCLWTAPKGSSDWTNVANQVAYYRPGVSGNVEMSFKPEAAGSYTLKVTTTNSDDALATQNFTVAASEEVTIDNITYRCVPTYQRAIVVSGEKDYNKKELVLPSTVKTSGGKICKVTKIDAEAFYNWWYLQSLVLPENLETIGERAFAYCNSLRKIELPSTLKGIGKQAFYGENVLRDVVSRIATPFAISNDVFLRWDDNSQNYVAPNATLYVESGKASLYRSTAGWDQFATIMDGLLQEKVLNHVRYSYVKGYPEATVIGSDLETVGDLKIPASVTIGGNKYAVKTIAPNAFETKQVSSLSLAEGLESIGSSAFSGNYNMTDFTIPSTLKSIGDQAFWNCNSLNKIELPEGFESIGNYAFGDCNGLQKLVLPSTIQHIGVYVIISCPAMAAVVSRMTNPVSIDEHTFESSRWNSTTQQNDYLPSPATLYVPAGSRAKYKAIEGWTKFKAIEEGELKETKVGDLYYSYSTGSTKATVIRGDYSSLESVNIPATVTIGSKAYQVKTVGSNAFGYYRNISSVTIANGIESIGYRALAGLNITEINLPSSLKEIADGAMQSCYRLERLIIPDGVKSIGDNAFSSCSGLTSVTIPNSVTSIGRFAFYYCWGMTSVTIGNGVTSIGDYAFSYCEKLTDVYCSAENVPNTSLEAFNSTNISGVTLHVPKGSVKAYEAKEPWNGFKKIVAIVAAKVTLDQTEAFVRKGKTLTLKATVTPADLSDKSVTWTSSNTKVVTVSANGEVKGIKVGTATITCTPKATGASATCEVTVGYVTLDKTQASVKKGKTITLTPTVYPTTLKDKSVTWKSSNTKVATVSADGQVKGLKAGRVIITCTSKATGLNATCQVFVGYVTLDQTVAVIKKGKTVTLTPTVYPTNLTDMSVTWKSSNAKVATVSADGLVTGVKAGTAIITCTSNATGLNASCKVTVGYVSLSESQTTIQKGKTQTLTPTVYPTSLTDKSVTWKSSNTKVATVTADGKVKGIKAGTATITCTSNATGLSATCKVTVTASVGTRSLDGDDDDATGIEDEMNDGVTEPYDVYDLSGRMVRHQVTSLDGLPNGIYIVNGRKVLKKE